MKNIIFIAPPASGKGTQSKLISEAYHIPHISTGDLLRDEVASGSVYGQMIKYEMDSGHLISDDFIVNLLRNRINRVDCNNGYILDGYPRNVEQAKIYDNLLFDLRKEIGVVIFLDIDKDLALKRTLSRLICSSCFASYNTDVLELRPKNEGFCDKCGHPLRPRGEDNEETFPIVFNNYLVGVTPLLDYYRQRNLLRVIKINEQDTVEDIFNKIKAVIDNEEANNS